MVYTIFQQKFFQTILDSCQTSYTVQAYGIRVSASSDCFIFYKNVSKYFEILALMLYVFLDIMVIYRIFTRLRVTNNEHVEQKTLKFRKELIIFIQVS